MERVGNGDSRKETRQGKIIRTTLLIIIILLLLGLAGGVAAFVARGISQKYQNTPYELAVKKGYSGSEEEWLASLVGEAGLPGRDGSNGLDGQNGKSAYELAVENGYRGSQSEWLTALVGLSGKDGIDGENGADGKSAYELAVENGFRGSLSEWLDSLRSTSIGEKGATGATGQSAYDLAVENGYQGSLTEWLVSISGKNGLNGQDGKDGVDGRDGLNGSNGKSAYDLAIENGYIGDLQTWLNSLVGAKGGDGKNGENGADGKSAYELAVENGYSGDVVSWISSLSGQDGISVSGVIVNNEGHLIVTLSSGSQVDVGKVTGDKGERGETGESGPQGPQGEPGEKGDDGADGKGISSITVDDKGHLIVSISDGSSIDCGRVEGEKGEKGEKGDRGEAGEKGADGEAGVSVVAASINNEGRLILTMSDNSLIDGGIVAGPKGEKGDKGDKGDPGVAGEKGDPGKGIASLGINSNGELVVIYSDGSSATPGTVVGEKGDRGDTGADGRGITSLEIDGTGVFKITLTDGSIVNLGNIKGEKGEKGDPGAVGATGATGRGVAGMAFNASGELIVTYTDGTEDNLGKVGSGGSGELSTQIFIFEERPDGTLAVVGVTEYGARLTSVEVPAYAYGKRVTVLAQGAFEKLGYSAQSEVRVVTLPNTITRIEDSGFMVGTYYANPQSIPDSVNYIGNHVMRPSIVELIDPTQWYVTLGSKLPGNGEKLTETVVLADLLEALYPYSMHEANTNPLLGYYKCSFLSRVTLGGYEFKPGGEYYIWEYNRIP